MPLEYKSIPFEVKEVVGVSGGGWEISGYASTFGGEPDTYGDVIVRGAFAESIATRSTKFLYEHTEPIGKQLEIREDDRGLFGRWSIVDTQSGTDAYKLAKAGVLDSLSIGYMTLEADYREDGVRLLRKVDLFEVSAVAIPANRNALITDVKRGRRKALAGQVAEFTLGDRVRVAGQPHMAGQGDGSVAIAEDTFVYGIVFDGMEEMGIRRWYTQDELAPAASPPSSGSGGGGGGGGGSSTPMQMSGRDAIAARKGRPFEAHTEDVRVAVLEWAERIRTGSDLRARDGKASPLTEARRSAVVAVSGSLRKAVDELDALLVSAPPAETINVSAELRRRRYQAAGVTLERPA